MKPILDALRSNIWLTTVVIVVGIAVPMIILSTCCRHRHSGGGGGGGGAALKTYNGMMATYQKKGYADIGRVYPHGTGGPSTNRGKFCGLYYEVNNAGERVTLIGVADANADCRADGDTDANNDHGYYIPSIKTHGPIKYLSQSTFTCSPKQGYWIGLCMYGGTMPYNLTNARLHYGIVAFPDDYGSSGEATFIVNEEGTVYVLDRGTDGKYLGTYPGPDPTKQGWEIAK